MRHVNLSREPCGPEAVSDPTAVVLLSLCSSASKVVVTWYITNTITTTSTAIVCYGSSLDWVSGSFFGTQLEPSAFGSSESWGHGGVCCFGDCGLEHGLQRIRLRGFGGDVGALIIRIGFWAPL